jgi:para-aminobenzoate synthetase component 1
MPVLEFRPTDEDFAARAFAWATAQKGPLCWLDSCGYGSYPHAHRPFLAGVGALAEMVTPHGQRADTFERLEDFLREKKYWSFGFLSYDLKNELENLSSAHQDPLGFPEAYWFHAETVLSHDGMNNWSLYTEGRHPAGVLDEIRASRPLAPSGPGSKIAVRADMDRETYLRRVARIQRHIVDGDLYEMNFCRRFGAEDVELDAPALYLALNGSSPAPFSGYFRMGGRHLLCASPERFLAKRGDRLIAQPIKGTAPRLPDPKADARAGEALRQSEKNRSENVMIVDLMRNDLAKSCLPGTVAVEELFGVYAFPQVWQMISTVTGRLRPGTTGLQAIRNAFPMGSMTGAPKVKSLELIERYENSKRGLFSGAMGYFCPEGDFDLNVVIRSLLYDENSRALSFSAGGAIVHDSVPEEEFEECLVKTAAIRRVLDADSQA